MREFEQMELEFFCKPGDRPRMVRILARRSASNWLLSLGMKEEHLRLRDHEKEELSFYSKATTDFEYLFPFGWGELWGIADRTDYDLKQHSGALRQERWNIWIRPRTRSSFPIASNRPSAWSASCFAFLCDAYDEEELERRRRPHRAAPASGARAVQGCRHAAPEEQAGRSGARAVREAVQAFHV